MNLLSDNQTITFISKSETDTQKFGTLLGSLLTEGCVVAVTGQLGAGKTYLTKGIAKGLGVEDSKTVTSPTFTLINEYHGRIPIYHIDAYRLRNSDEMVGLGSDEIFGSKSVSIVEWAENVKECLPDDFLSVSIVIDDNFKRHIKIVSSGTESDKIINQLTAKLNVFLT